MEDYLTLCATRKGWKFISLRATRKKGGVKVYLTLCATRKGDGGLSSLCVLQEKGGSLSYCVLQEKGGSESLSNSACDKKRGGVKSYLTLCPTRKGDWKLI